MTQSTLPKMPVDNWEQIRQEWIMAVEQVMSDVEAWSQKQEWAVRRDVKTITENRLGSYTVPRLLIHAPEGRLLLDPVARYVVGANGLIDFYALPSYDAVMIARTAEGWQLYKTVSKAMDSDVHKPWSEQLFLETANELFKAA